METGPGSEAVVHDEEEVDQGEKNSSSLSYQWKLFGKRERIISKSRLVWKVRRKATENIHSCDLHPVCLIIEGWSTMIK